MSESHPLHTKCEWNYWVKLISGLPNMSGIIERNSSLVYQILVELLSETHPCFTKCEWNTEWKPFLLYQMWVEYRVKTIPYLPNMSVIIDWKLSLIYQMWVKWVKGISDLPNMNTTETTRTAIGKPLQMRKQHQRSADTTLCRKTNKNDKRTKQ